MDFLIEPYIGAGPIHLGMGIQEVRDAVGEMPKPFRKFRDDDFDSDHFVRLGVIVSYKQPGVCETIEFAKPAKPLLLGEPIVGRPFSAVRKWLEGMDADLVVEADGLQSPKYGISVYAPSALKKPNLPVESVMVFETGYWN